MRVCCIANPGSKGGKSKKSFDKIRSLFKMYGIVVDFKVTNKLGDAYIFSKEANLSGYDKIVAIGGDGTISQVLNGFFDERGELLSQATMGIIHTGTSPDFCKHYQIPLCLEDAVRIVVTGKTKEIKIGKIFFPNHPSNEQSVKYFSCCANIGMGGGIADRSNKLRPFWGDRLGTFFATLLSLFKYKPNEIQVVTSEGTLKLPSTINLSVGITKYVASGIYFNTELIEDEERFYLIQIHNVSAKNLIPTFRTLYSGKKIQNSDSLKLFYENKVVLSSDHECGVEFDGDSQGSLPCEIEVNKTRLRICVP